MNSHPITDSLAHKLYESGAGAPVRAAKMMMLAQSFESELTQRQGAQYSIEEIADYISGWSMGPYESVHEIGQAVLLNALSQLQCDQDGIAAVRARKQSR
jgi:hypothetical protein